MHTAINLQSYTLQIAAVRIFQALPSNAHTDVTPNLSWHRSIMNLLPSATTMQVCRICGHFHINKYAESFSQIHRSRREPVNYVLFQI